MQHPSVAYAVDVRARNLVLDGFNLLSAPRHMRRGEIPGCIADVADYLAQPLRWATGRERSDTFVRDDLRPALWECALLCKSLGQKLTRPRREVAARRRSELAA